MNKQLINKAKYAVPGKGVKIMNKDKKPMKFVPTERNKGLEPIPVMGGNLIMGHNEEIHEEDSIIFSYEMPLGAIKRLIKSYYETLQSICGSATYTGQSGSWEIRMEPYCNRMIWEIIEQLNKHGLDGKKVDDEVFNRYFKDDYEKMKRFSKNHGSNVMESFEPCNDPKCCEPKLKVNSNNTDRKEVNNL